MPDKHKITVDGGRYENEEKSTKIAHNSHVFSVFKECKSVKASSNGELLNNTTMTSL